MKKLLSILICFSLALLGFGQEVLTKHGFGINQDFHDYNVRILDKKITSFDSSLSQSIRLSYTRSFSRSWALNAGLNNGFLLNNMEEHGLVRKSYLVGLDADLILKLNNGFFFPQNARIAPFLSFGYNFNYHTNYRSLGWKPIMVSNEYGLGFNTRLGAKSFITLGVALDQQLNGDFDTHVQYRLGYAQTISKKQIISPNNNDKKDYDGDGIADADDDCPTLAGIDARHGCPENWSESGQVNDSIVELVSELEDILISLKADIDYLKSNRVVEVKCEEDENTNPTHPKTIETKNSEDKTNTNPTNEKTTGEKTTTAQNGHSDDKTSDQKDKVDGQKDVAKNENDGVKTTDESKVNSEDNKNTTKTTEPVEKIGGNGYKPKGFDPLTGYKTDDEPKAYYVVAISTLDPKLAERAASLIAADYPIVKILPQSNGYYRVGVYATRTKLEADKILGYAKTHGIPSGWISYE